MAIAAAVALRNSMNEGTTFMPKITTITRRNRPTIRAIRLSPRCVFIDVRIVFPLPLSAERPEAPQLVQVEPDEEGAADDVLVRHEPPDPAVARVVPVVTHHEVMPRRNRARQAAHIVVAISGERERAPGHHRGGRVVVEQYFMLGAAHRLHVAARELHALLREVVIDLAYRDRVAVDREPLVAVLDAVAGQADHALDVIERRVVGKA